MSKQARKPIKWVGSAKRDLDSMPADVKNVFGHAIDLAQAGDKHQDATTQGREAGLRGLAIETRGPLMSRNTEISIGVGSTNVYADLGYTVSFRQACMN